MRSLTLAMLTTISFLGTPALAQTSDSPSVPQSQRPDLSAYSTCVDESIANGQPAAECVSKAQAGCMIYSPQDQAALATLCFIDAKRTWSEAIAGRLKEISSTQEEKLAAVAGIEVRYDLLTNMLQCDRLSELALLGETPGNLVGLQKARCESTATAMALTKLILQSRNLK